MTNEWWTKWQSIIPKYTSSRLVFSTPLKYQFLIEKDMKGQWRAEQLKVIIFGNQGMTSHSNDDNNNNNNDNNNNNYYYYKFHYKDAVSVFDFI